MASASILLLVLAVQGLVSAYGARRLAGRGFGIASLSCLAIPAIIMLFAIVTIFDVNGMTEGGARVILPLAAGLATFIIAGFVAAVFGFRLGR